MEESYFSPAQTPPEQLRALLERYGVQIPGGGGALTLNLGSQPLCPAGATLARREPECVVGGLRLLQRALELPRAWIAVGEAFEETWRLLRGCLPRGGELEPICYEPEPMEPDEACLTRRLGPVRLVTAQLCCAAFYAFYEEQPYTQRLVSLAGSCLDEPRVLPVPFGATLGEVLAQTEALPREPACILLGDPRWAESAADLQTALPDSSDGLIFLTQAELRARRPRPCLRCGRCAQVCPAQLAPYRLAQGLRTALTGCIECGLCTYYCPAHQPLSALVHAQLEEAAG